MIRETPVVAIVGAGVAGLALAGALSSRGMTVRVYEQAGGFTRLGAGIQQSANAVKVLRSLGFEPALLAKGFVPDDFIHRAAETGEVTNTIPLGTSAAQRYGAPHLLLHRGDLHDVLRSVVRPEVIRRGCRVVGIDHRADGIELSFADGRRERADAVIGADGIHSVIRESLFGAHVLRFSGQVGYRATFPATRLSDSLDDNTKWWGPDRHLIVYHITATRDEVYAMGTVPEPDFDVESWSAKGDVTALRRAFVDFHPTVQRILQCVPEVHKWALADRDRLPRWGEGQVALMGDAAHPMMPHMGQGAAMAIEDVAIMVRCIDHEGHGNWSRAFKRFQATRQERTAQMQAISAGNAFARTGKDAVDWVYGYDALTAPLAPSPAQAGW